MLKQTSGDRRTRWFCPLLLVVLIVGLASTSRGIVQAAPRDTGTLYGPVVVRPGGAQLYNAPGGDLIGTLPTSTIFTARGRTADELWVMGEAVSETESAGEQGWLQVAQVIAVGVELLPVVDGEATLPATTDGNTPAVTATPTVTGTTSSEATPSLIGTVASGDDRLNVRNGPGTTYPIIARILPGESYPVVGRPENTTGDIAWLQIDRGDGDFGWVSAEYMDVAGDISTLPVVTTAPPPTVSPLPATQIPATQSAAPADATVAGLRGTLIIQSSPGGMIYAYSLDSGTLWPLTTGFDPALSPDGQTVAFVRNGGEHGLYLIDIASRASNKERLIFSGRARLSSPKWSPDGQWILFTRGDEEYHCLEIGSGCISPPSAPDGSEITIPGVETATRYWYNLARVDRDGNNYRDIAALPSARAADWNAAGIVYQSDAGLQITADVPDAENKLVIFDYLKPFFFDPDWQPQGGRIVYMGKEASHWEIFAVNPDGRGKAALTRPATTIVDEIPSNVAPAWSPDGQHIAFLSNRDERGEAGAWRVWVMDADGGNQRALPIDLEINYTFGGEQSISWGP